jgi:hypothetical protein
MLVGVLMSQEADARRLMGAGVSSCGTWTEDRKIPASFDAVQDAQWAEGFLSGVGWLHTDGIDPLNGLDANAVLAWLDNYCAAHPLDQIDDAVGAFVQRHPR